MDGVRAAKAPMVTAPMCQETVEFQKRQLDLGGKTAGYSTPRSPIRRRTGLKRLQPPEYRIGRSGNHHPDRRSSGPPLASGAGGH
jgi:hypothetical protein